jgi:C4-dicarboxylate-specific signal transduction histidine kinase
MSTPTLPSRLVARARSWRRRRAPLDAEQGRRLAERVTALEAGLEESRRLNQRLADVVDVVTEVLVPAADRDDERLRQALANLNKTLDNPEDSAD